VRDNFFVELKCGNGMNVIGCFNIETRQWNILDFCLELRINGITGFEEGSLVVHTNAINSKKHHFYKILFG
jgi:hypothetical protein